MNKQTHKQEQEKVPKEKETFSSISEGGAEQEQEHKQEQNQEQALSNQVVSDDIVTFLSSVLWSHEQLYRIAKSGALKIALLENCSQTMATEIVRKEILDVVIKQFTKADSELKKNVANIPSEIFDGSITEASMSATSILVLKQLAPELSEIKAQEFERISKLQREAEQQISKEKNEDDNENKNNEEDHDQDESTTSESTTSTSATSIAAANPKIDEWTVRELVLSVENDSDLYDKRAIPLAENYIKKLRKGRFRTDLAVKGVLGLVLYEMKKLRQSKINIGRVSVESKMAASEHLYESYLQPIMEQLIRDEQQQEEEEDNK
jgi:hypothetical protein